MVLKGYLFALLYGIICLGIALVAYKVGLPKKYSRKLVHILVGFEWVILYRYVGVSYHFLIVCLIFTALLLVSHLKKLMPMISSESDNSPGTVYYGVAMSIMATVSLFCHEMIIPFGIGVFCTSFGDGFAGVFGQLVKKGNPKIYGNKTLIGTLSNFLFSFGSALVFDAFFELQMGIWKCIAIGVLSVGIELITGFGLDNIATTLGTSFLAYCFIYAPLINHFIIPILLTPFIVVIVKEKKVLTGSGLFCALVLDLIITLTLGNIGFVLLLAFLALSVLVDKVKKSKKGEDTVSKRGDCRDHIQVIANGLIPMMMALLYSVTFRRIFAVAYVAALAEALADTCASGFGAFSKTTFDIFKMRKCKKGLSGGMSVIGTLTSLVGAFLLGGLAMALGVLNLKLMIVASASAFLGGIFDSLLGSLLQVKYKCCVCSEITEREVHCNKRTKRVSGAEFFDNDVVNLFSGAFSAILAAVVSLFII